MEAENLEHFTYRPSPGRHFFTNYPLKHGFHIFAPPFVPTFSLIFSPRLAKPSESSNLLGGFLNGIPTSAKFVGSILMEVRKRTIYFWPYFGCISPEISPWNPLAKRPGLGHLWSLGRWDPCDRSAWWNLWWHGDTWSPSGGPMSFYKAATMQNVSGW